MENILVRDLMVPISAYATVSVGTPLLEAMRVLERAQAAYTKSRYQHRAILVLDEHGDVVGRIGQMRILRAIDREFGFFEDISDLKTFHFSDQHIALMRDRYRVGSAIPSGDTLRSIAGKNVESIMQRPTPGEYVADDCHLEIAIHKLVDGTHLGLLVTKGTKIVGVLRSADVYAAVFQDIKEMVREEET